MPDWKGAAQNLKRPQVAIPVGALAVTGVTAIILGFFLQRWVYLIAALLVLLIGLLAFLVYSLYSKERDSRVARGVAPEGDATLIRRKEQRAAVGLEEGFRKAVAVIEARQLGHLPWYLVLGAPDAGKTALLRASGLELPAAVERLVEPGPTTSCNWWLTNQAVVIDTAGRYSTAHEGGDHREWKQLLALVRKYRPRPALQGVLIALSAADLLSKAGPQLEAEASELRRHLNEIVDAVGVDPPIYLIVTQADRIQGFTEAAAGFAGSRLHEAIGWTHRERYPHDAAQTVRDAFSRIRERIEGMLPDLLIREPEPARRRRLFFLPQEIAALSRSISAFAGRAFAPALYDEAPFLRGIYLVSALREGAIVSPVVDRLGHAWAQGSVDTSGPSGSWFLHDFFRRLLLDSEEQTLTVPADRVGPRTRAVVLGLAGAAAGVLAVVWGITAWNNWQAIDAVTAAAVDTRERRESLDAVDHLWQSLAASEKAREEGMHGMGLGGPLDRAVERGRRVFLASFARDFEEPAKQVLLASVKGEGDDSFASLQDLAVDVDYLASRAGEGSSMPELARYSEVRRSDSERTAFAAAYEAYVRWAPQVEIQTRIEAERQRLDEEAPRLLDVTRLAAWCASRPELAKPIRYQDIGLPASDPAISDRVSGCFTRKFFEERLGGLIRGLERSGKLSQESAERFRDDYARRYAESWEDFLVGAPRPPAPDPQVAQSPYVKLVAAIDENVGLAELWRRGEPSWIAALARCPASGAGEGRRGSALEALRGRARERRRPGRARARSQPARVRYRARGGGWAGQRLQEGRRLRRQVARADRGGRRRSHGEVRAAQHSPDADPERILGGARECRARGGSTLSRPDRGAVPAAALAGGARSPPRPRRRSGAIPARDARAVRGGQRAASAARGPGAPVEGRLHPVCVGWRPRRSGRRRRRDARRTADGAPDRGTLGSARRR